MGWALEALDDSDTDIGKVLVWHETDLDTANSIFPASTGTERCVQGTPS